MSDLKNSFKEDVRKWGFSSRARMLANVNQQAKGVSKSKPSLRSSLTAQVAADGEIPTAVRFGFPRHGVFFEKGVRKGVGMASPERKPHPWFNPVIDDKLDELADIAAQNMSTLAINKIKIV